MPITRNFARRLIVPPMNMPSSSAFNKQEGLVVLGLHLSAAGVIDAWVITSSGFEEIDQSALRMLRRGRTEGDFPPAGNVVQFTVTFTSSKKK
ncbi:TonB family protein [Achromobacter marplatensis]|uniref:TonB family protein n=1 Tax=Achromobacter marplatensis TaxID=470868 RepID=UPI0039F6B8AA